MTDENVNWNSRHLTLNVRGPSFLGLTRSISLLLMTGSLRRQDISSHDIDNVEYVGPGLTWGRILSTSVISMWSNDIKCKYLFIFTLQNLARKGLIVPCAITYSNRILVLTVQTFIKNIHFDYGSRNVGTKRSIYTYLGIISTYYARRHMYPLMHWFIIRQNSNISRTKMDHKSVDHLVLFGASPFGAALTTSSFST